MRYWRGEVLRPGWSVVVPSRAPSAATTASPATTGMVARGDSIWAMAKKRLASVFHRRPTNARVAEYTDRMIAANRNRLVHRDDPDLIFPGQELVEPAMGPQTRRRPAPMGPSPRRRLPASGPATTSPSIPAPSPPATTEERAQPPVEALAPAPGGVVSPSRSTAPSRPGAAAQHRDGATTGPPGWMAAAGGMTGATALASWALVMARRRRATHLRGFRAGEVFPPPDPTVGPMTVAVRANADVAGLDRLDAALRHLAGVAATPVTPRPQAMLRQPNGDVEVFLAEPIGAAVGPWTAKAAGAIWALAGDAVLPSELDSPSPCPALVQLGTCEDGAELYVDLEALGALGLDGGPEAVRQIARALTATVVVSPAAQLCRVLTYGFDPYGLAEQAPTRLVVADTLDPLLAEAESTARPIAQAVDQERAGSSFRLRAAVTDEGLEPAIVIVVGGSLSAEQEARLSALGAAGGRGVAVVRLGLDAPWTLEATEPVGWWRLNPLGLAVRPVGLAGQELQELAAFLADADAQPLPVDARAPLPSGDAAAPTSTAPAAIAEPYRERDWRLMVRLLGPVDIVSRDGKSSERGDRSQPLELAAWLATHRGLSTRTGAKEALWAGRDIAPQTFSNVISGSRLLLVNLAGDPPGGGEWIPARKEGIELHPMVVTDVDLLAERVAYAKRVGAEGAGDALAGAMHLLRGVPLEGQPWLWADLEHTASRLAVQAVSVATDLATLRLQAGDIRGALDATDVGLRVIPSHDQLIELSIRAWMANGDRRTARPSTRRTSAPPPLAAKPWQRRLPSSETNCCAPPLRTDRTGRTDLEATPPRAEPPPARPYCARIDISVTSPRVTGAPMS